MPSDSSHYEKLPLGWTFTRLKDIGSYGSGKTPKAAELHSTGKYPYFKISDMNTAGNEKYLELTKLFLPESYIGILFDINSIVFPKNGGAVLTNKKRMLTQPSLVDLNTGVFTPSTMLDADYMWYYFTTIDFTDQSKGGVIPTLDRSVIEERIMLIPPIKEQRRIVAAIEAGFDRLTTIVDNLT